ncbi:hypothetical protein JCM8547_005718 [Rhodosporidiobolus lusitaniae]
MPSTLDELPNELLLKIFDDYQDDFRSDRTRQSNLARLALVNSTFSSVAHTLLYGSRAVTVRSAGRTFLLARTLSSNPDLASVVKHFVARSEMDNGHLPSLVQILSTAKLTSVTLSSVFFAKDPPVELYSALQAQNELLSFSYGYHGLDSPLGPIAPLLQSWPALKNLTLAEIAAVRRDQSSFPFTPSRELRSWGPPPPYRLSSLSISNVRIINLVGWSLPAFEWLLGSMNSPSSLTSLTLVEFDGLFDLAQLFSLLSSRGCSNALERLTIRNFRDATTQSSFPIEEGQEDVEYAGAFDPNNLSAYFPSLRHLSLDNNDDETCFSTPHPHLLLPPSLRTIELYEDLFLTWNLLQTVEDGAPPSLGAARLVGPFASDPDVKQLKAACEKRGIAFRVERSF